MRSNNDSLFIRALDAHYPTAIPQSDFVRSSIERLAPHGFEPGRALASVAVCRDELAGPLLADVEAMWGPAFSLASLAGMLTGGRTAIAAAADHAPIHQGRRRLVLYAMAHIGLDGNGRPGMVHREGLTRPSSACGALTALQAATRAGGPAPAFDPTDPEQSLLALRLAPTDGQPRAAGLVELTDRAALAIDEDASRLLAERTGRQTTGEESAPIDAALFTGIQIHGPDGASLVQPLGSHLLVGGEPRDLDAKPEPEPDPSRRPKIARWLARGAVASTVLVIVGARRPVSPRVGL
ncbi:MAG: hypothetical protein AAFN30_05485 [Actinomycetota bacterium]